MSETVLIPIWLYERAVASLGREEVDRIMVRHNAVAVAEWEPALINLDEVKRKVNHG